MSRRAGILLAMALAACTSPSYPYEGPPRSEVEPARLNVRYADVPTPGDLDPGMALHVYDLGDACLSRETLKASYRGMLRLDRFGREIAVSGNRYTFLRLRFRGFEETSNISCTVSGGFLPTPGQAYSLEFLFYSGWQCLMTLHERDGTPVLLSHPPDC